MNTFELIQLANLIKRTRHAQLHDPAYLRTYSDEVLAAFDKHYKASEKAHLEKRDARTTTASRGKKPNVIGNAAFERIRSLAGDDLALVKKIDNQGLADYLLEKFPDECNASKNSAAFYKSDYLGWLRFKAFIDVVEREVAAGIVPFRAFPFNTGRKWVTDQASRWNDLYYTSASVSSQNMGYGPARTMYDETNPRLALDQFHLIQDYLKKHLPKMRTSDPHARGANWSEAIKG